MNFNVIWHVLLFTLIHFVAANREGLIRDHGNIIFFDNTWTFNFHLNLKSYVENAVILENSTIALIKLCQDLPAETNCQFFIHNLREEAKNAQKDIMHIQQFSRSKRFAWGALFRSIAKEALLCFGVIAATEIINENRMEEVRAQLKENRELVLAQLEISKIQNEIIADTSNQVVRLHKSVHELNETTINVNKLNDLLQVASVALNIHSKQTMKFINILNGDLRAQFFNVIDAEKFNNETTLINNKLLPSAKLPASNPQDLLDLSKISSNSNDTHISIVVKTPIITNKTYEFHEFIPIPIKTDSSVHILNSNAKYFLRTKFNKTKYIPLSTLSKCNTVNSRTFCNSIVEVELRDANSCMMAIISNTSDPNCRYREIDYQNYILRISPNIIFCFIVKPISLRIACSDKSMIYELSKNTEINFSEHCDLHKISNEFHYDSNTHSSVEINYPRIQPNFTIFDPKYEKWISNISMINRNSIKMLKINNEIEIIDTKSELIHESSKSFGSTIFSPIKQFGLSIINYTKDFFILNSFFLIGIYIIPPIIVYILTYLLCYRMKSFSSQARNTISKSFLCPLGVQASQPWTTAEIQSSSCTIPKTQIH